MSREDRGPGHRQLLPANLVKAMRYNFSRLGLADISAYTFERRKTSYPQAKADLSIFDDNGELSMEGREFPGGQISLWPKKDALSATT